MHSVYSTLAHGGRVLHRIRLIERSFPPFGAMFATRLPLLCEPASVSSILEVCSCPVLIFHLLAKMTILLCISWVRNGLSCKHSVSVSLLFFCELGYQSDGFRGSPKFTVT